MRPMKLVLALLACCAVLTGCGGKSSTVPTPPATTSDASLVSAAVLADPTLLRDDLYESTNATALGLGAPIAAGPRAAILPITFFRMYTLADRTLGVTFADSDATGRPRRADVQVNRDLTGLLHIWVVPPTGPNDTTNVVHKVVHDAWTRTLRLARVVDSTAPDSATHWVLQGASAITVRSNAAQVAIRSVSLRGSPLAPFTFTIDDPTLIGSAAARPVLPAGQYTTVRIDTGVPGQVAFLYSLDRRIRMYELGLGLYEAAMYIDPNTASLANLHFAVNVMSRGTLFDDALPYDSDTWILPYAIGLPR
ncbi:MAG: hypothetical protein RL760_29 [Candidatus Eisenbacteria bacterium]